MFIYYILFFKNEALKYKLTMRLYINQNAKLLDKKLLKDIKYIFLYQPIAFMFVF